MSDEALQYPRTHLLGIPPEIREQIYSELLNPEVNRVYHQDEYSSYNYGPALQLFKVNRQIYVESRKIFRDLNIFVRIETPWPEAQSHVAIEGHVPILVSRNKASQFRDHRLNVRFSAPVHANLDWDMQCFVILAEDLDKFTSICLYSDLSHPGLNEHLAMDLELRDPYAPEWDEKRMPKDMQRKLLLPFGNVKNLARSANSRPGTIILGDVKPFPSIEQELRKTQEEPYKTPEHCLRETTRFKAEGNAELAKGDYQAALRLYNEAWRAMHIEIKGRKRHVHADAYFARDLREEPFKGMNGQAERLKLRVQLVANTCQVLLKLHEYEDCAFWGMRSIRMIREAMGIDERQTLTPEHEAVLGFPAAVAMGRIYFRTAVALKELGDKAEARRLLMVAEVYLPTDQSIRKEIAAIALKIG
jgi:hypothetical protein